MEKTFKYYAIKRDLSNPLWRQYIKWLNDTHGSRWGGSTFKYYGYDGNIKLNGTDAHNSLEQFDNNTKLITLEDWNKVVNKTEQ